MRVSRTTLGAAGMFLFALALYGSTLFHGYVLDDNTFFTKNDFVQSGLGGVAKILTTEHGAGAGERQYTYRPLVLMMFAVEKTLFGNNPVVGHGLNILLYAAACAGLFLLLSKILAALPLFVALLAALLFAAHPTHAEVVANIKSRDEILCFLFLLGLLASLLRFAAGGKARHLAAGLGLFALALLTKESAITFVALVPLTLHFFSGLPPRTIAKTTVPFALLAALYLLLRKAIVGAVSMPGDFDGITNILKLAQTPSEALGTRLIILWNYLRLLFFPLRLSWDYSYNIIPVTTVADPRAIAAGFVFLALAVAGLRGIKRRSVTAFGVLFFLVTFSIVSNLVILIRWTLAERFLFTPSLGFCIAAVAGGFVLLERFRLPKNSGRIALVSFFSLVVLAFSARTVTRNADWKSEFDLSLRDSETYPGGARVHYLLGIAYKDRAGGSIGAGERRRLLLQALEEYRRSISIFPDFSRSHQGLAYVHNELGDFAKAEQASRRALELAPDSADSANLLASACLSQQRYEEASAFCGVALKLKPDFPEAHNNLGVALVKTGRFDEGIIHLQEALRRRPGNSDYQMNLALARAMAARARGRGSP